jgi:hypothetical protein
MDARSVTKMPDEERLHRRERLAREWRGGIVVEVDHEEMTIDQ